jgi:tripartite ATP-independent transporter DctM subunit
MTDISAAPPGSAKDPPCNGKFVKFGRRTENAIKWATEIPAALLVGVETILLLVNVFYRYILHDPLTWGDELASMLFMWMAMFGAVIALRRNEHMKLSTLINRMPPERRAFMNTFAGVVVIAFLLALIPWAYEYAIEEWFIITPALEIRNTFRVAALPVGLSFMLIIAINRLIESARWRDFFKSAALVGGLALLLFAARTHLSGLGNLNLVVFFLIGVPVLVIAGVPIMASFGLATLAYLGTVTDTPLLIVVGRMDEGMSSIILLAVPLFIFLGALIEAMGMAEAMIVLLVNLIGHIRGGLSYVLLGGMYLISGISGAKAADMAAVAPVLFPEMKKRGEDEGELVAMLSSSGAMSETIPPSLVLITIGSVVGLSISDLFTGGFMPALVGALAMSAVIWWKNRKRQVARVGKVSRNEILRSLMYAIPAVTLPFIIRIAVVKGVATATEVATIGVAYSFIIGLLIYRRRSGFDWKRLYPMLVDTVSLSGAVLIIIGCASAMAWALTQSGFSKQLSDLMMGVPGGKTGFLLVSAIGFVFLGSFLEGIPSIVLFGPLLFPIAQTMGVHEVQYAMIVIFAMGLGLFAPPLGVGFYVACAISKADPSIAMKKVWPYLGALFVALLLLLAFPWISIGFL